MSLWEAYKPMMDAQVDNGLGDSISYVPEGASEPLGDNGIIHGFISMWGDGGGADGIDPAAIRWFAKIKKTHLPHRPKRGDRLTAAKLGGTPYQPQASNHMDNGDYWIFDIARI